MLVMETVTRGYTVLTRNFGRRIDNGWRILAFDSGDTLEGVQRCDQHNNRECQPEQAKNNVKTYFLSIHRDNRA